MVISDSLLTLLFHYPLFGYFSCFTYSGFLMISLLFSYRTPTHLHGLLASASVGTLFFWLWTNFGVWLTSGLYAKSIAGFGLCYLAALPFLRNALIGSLLWMIIYYCSLQVCFKKTAREITS
jgi:hypothetical protein